MSGQPMKYGVVLPGGTAGEQLAQAVLAEGSGWDGVFVWEAGYGVDAWCLLSAMAVKTSRVKLGTMLTPLPWRRPWKVASQVATLDQISGGGRAILAAGVGALGTGLPDTGEVTGLRGRAERMDEGIDLIRMLWEGGTSYRGQHYQYDCDRDDLTAAVRVKQRIPIWVVGVWPRPKSMRRALRCDGIIPQYNLDGKEPTPDDARAVRAWLDENGAEPGMDMVADGETPADDAAAATAAVSPWAQAGCTWWLETRWELPHDSAERMAEIRDRLAAGPPTSPS
jgi:alkanesulfonate monooxygenase SsuD/methylene tetrahydromethanopterin reductase-like flavin-dependent oxidoreductase (luciferase family)